MRTQLQFGAQYEKGRLHLDSSGASFCGEREWNGLSSLRDPAALTGRPGHPIRLVFAERLRHRP
jgi:hypothetical protein